MNQAMFDILEADILVFQETKIQRKDLQDDMVLVPGWDCYWSLPRHKKGYSGVVIYTRQSVCAPIRAEEGISGILCPPNSSTSFCDLPEELQIGGYPLRNQLEDLNIDLATLDSEGRCVILEFPAFVLIGTYCPANRDETRDDFRLGFLDLLDARVRNLVAMGKRVFLTGDLNISKEALDTANAEASMRKNGVTAEEYWSTPARRFLNHLLEDGTVIGSRDEGREKPVLWDICRGFHPTRKGMFTCWEQKVNARPANFGARIDYVLCSLDMKEWFFDSNIQEGLMGSDHCPVYATLKDKIVLDGKETYVQDLMNPKGMFYNGARGREHSARDLLPMSGKLIPEFDRRQNIRDMFTRKPSTVKSQSTAETTNELMTVESKSAIDNRPLKRAKNSLTVTPTSNAVGKGQQSLKGFFKTKSIPIEDNERGPPSSPSVASDGGRMLQPAAEISEGGNAGIAKGRGPVATPTKPSGSRTSRPTTPQKTPPAKLPSTDTKDTPSPFQVHDPIVSKESWSKLFTKPAAPRCEGHDEPCISLLTKKSGINCGRSFWMCPRPLGPTGAKEKNTQWRCGTFIWCSDWNSG